jgi:hypothetical protein
MKSCASLLLIVNSIPIEIGWTQVKGYMREHNQLFTLTEVERLVHEGFGVVTAERWRRMIAHVQETVEDHCWEHDSLYEEMEKFTFHVGGSSDESSSSSSDYEEL